MHRNVIKSFAKINLFLNVVSKKKKFHRIQSLFSFIDLHDKIEISTTNRKKHFIKFDGKFSKGISKKNSISTLLKILDQKGLIKKKYYIKVTKNIPKIRYGWWFYECRFNSKIFFKKENYNFK